MTRLVWMLAIDLVAAGAGLVAGFWTGRRRACAGMARPAFWPWLSAALLALAFETFSATFPTLTGRLPLWVQRGTEPTLWGLALALLAFGVAAARWPRKIARPSPFLLVALHAVVAWPIASFLPDTRLDGMAVQSFTSGSAPAAFAHLFRLYGVDANQREMGELFGTTIRGTSPVAVLDGLARLGLQCERQPLEGVGMYMSPAVFFRGAGLKPSARLVTTLGPGDDVENLMNLAIVCDAEPDAVQRVVGSGTLSLGPRQLVDRSPNRACPTLDSDEHFFAPAALYVPGLYIHRAINLWSEHYSRRWFSRVLRSMNEPSLSCGGRVGRTYRFLWLPAFHPQVVVRVEVHTNSARMTTLAIHDDGNTVERLSVELDASAWQALETEILSSHIEDVAATSTEGQGIRDGVRIVFEARSEKHYKLVYRDNPHAGPILELGRTFLRLSQAKSGEVLLADYLQPFIKPMK
jgi:hypothetical protein